MTDAIEVQNENAFQRIARLQKRPSLLNLEKNVFSHGPQPGEIVEVFGPSSVGKTFLFLEFIKKCILPKIYKEWVVGGLEAGVILLNTDHHFEVMTLVKFLKTYLKRCFFQKKSESLINEIIEESLKKLTIFNIYNSETLHTTLFLVQRHLLMNQEISLILLDSISAFYWQDRIDKGKISQDSYVLKILENLHKCIHPFKVTIMFTRPLHFQTESNMVRDCSSTYALKNINTSIELKTCDREESSSHLAEIRTSNAYFVKFFSITSQGILWSL